MNHADTLSAEVVRAAWKRFGHGRGFDLVSTSKAMEAAHRGILEDVERMLVREGIPHGPAARVAGRVARSMVRTSIDSVHRMVRGDRPTGAEFAVWFAHVGPEIALLALADVLGKTVVDEGDADRMDALSEAGEHLAHAMRLVVRHRSPSSDGGADVTDDEHRIEAAAIERAILPLHAAKGGRRGAA